MLKGSKIVDTHASNDTNGEGNHGVRILAVGEHADWTARGMSLPDDKIAYVSFGDVTSEMLNRLRPEVIYSPVLARRFDCIDLAMVLHSLGFEGVYRACGDGLPKPALIVREVRQICPRLKFEISELGD